MMWPEIALCFLGWLAHFLMALSDMSASRGIRVTPSMYMRERPYKTSLSVIGAIVGYVALLQMSELTLLTAFGAGYIANASIDQAGKIAAIRTGNRQ